jgi:bacterioferritin
MQAEQYEESLKSKLIEGLNEDLRHEYQAIIMYNTFAALTEGIHRPILKQFFESEIPDELRHAQFLANKITALGAEPVTSPGKINSVTGAGEMLKEVLKAESEAIERYVKRRLQAEKFGDFGLANDLEEIISDETRHKEETEKLMRGLDSN